MKNLTRNNDQAVQDNYDCVARHRPDWSKLQAVASETETEVRLYKDEVLLARSQKIKAASIRPRLIP